MGASAKEEEMVYKVRWKWPKKSKAPKGMPLAEARRRLLEEARSIDGEKIVYQCKGCGRKNLGECVFCRRVMTREERSERGASGISVKAERLVKE